MPTPFSAATAEQAIAAVEAVVISGQPTSVEFVADFLELPSDQAESALSLAADLGFLVRTEGKFSAVSPLCRFVVTPNQMQKAAVLRLMLESYAPFVRFRERLVATDLAQEAARQTKTILDLKAHPEDVKDTLVSLGTYSNALSTEGGGRYRPDEGAYENALDTMLQGCREAASAEARVREQLGPEASGRASREEVIIPLADAVLKARSGDSRGAVVAAGNAVESYLAALAGRVSVDLVGAAGLNAKLDRFDRDSKIPKKLVYVGKYLGHVRNAADHGTDDDVGAPWSIRKSTGVEYVFVACSFLAGLAAREQGAPPEI